MAVHTPRLRRLFLLNEYRGFPVRTFFTICLLCLLVGCGGQPEYSNRVEYDQLEDYAKTYVDDVLSSYFGTPTEIVAWEKLPLRFHLAEGTTTAASNRTVSFELDEPHLEIPSGAELLWETEESSGSAWIREWDEEAHQATLESSLSSSLDPGTKVILGPGQVIAQGRMLYAEHCQHCHGVAGDGNGPTAPYLNPRPRDYRKGVFKFTTTQGSKKPTRGDLERVIENGIPGTYMPSFKLLTEDEMTSIVEYVIFLSMRGELEYQLVRLLSDSYSTTAVDERTAGGERYADIEREFKESVNDPDSLPFEIETIASRMAQEWASSQEEKSIIQPLTPRVPYSEESIAIGRELYLKESLKCAQCHGEAGFGNGSQTYAVSKDEAGNENPLPGLYDTWGNPVQPRNLHTGIYRGGRRPIDLYARIYAGIKGTPMPAFSTTLLRRSDPEDPSSEMTDEDIWHLVNYIYSVPFEDVETGAGSGPAGPANGDSGSGDQVAVQ